MIPVLEFVAGCIVLAIGADNFLKSSISIARRYGLPQIIIGVILVGFGTSFAEVIVAAVASAHGKPQLAIGNVLGSNIANIGLVIGIAAMIKPLFVSSQFIKREFPVLIIVTLIAGALMWNGKLSRIDGIILLIILVFHVVAAFCFAPKDKVINEEVDGQGVTKSEMSFKKALIMWPVGLIFLFISSELIVDGAVKIATWLHLSELLIGLTVVAIGTSLPELATIVLSAMKKQHDIAIGTIVGSNIFNLLAVLAMPGLIRPTGLPTNFMHLYFPCLLAFTILFYAFAFWPKKRSDFSRLEGGFLVLAYIAYIVIIVFLD